MKSLSEKTLIFKSKKNFTTQEILYKDTLYGILSQTQNNLQENTLILYQILSFKLNINQKLNLMIDHRYSDEYLSSLN